MRGASLALIAAVCLLAGCNQASAPDSALPIQETTATAMAAAYAANEPRAQQQFDNHRIRIDGEVSRINLDFTGKAVVQLDGGTGIVSAQMADTGKQWAAGLSPGYHVAMLCDGPGYILGVVALGDCLPQDYTPPAKPKRHHRHRRDS